MANHGDQSVARLVEAGSMSCRRWLLLQVNSTTLGSARSCFSGSFSLVAKLFSRRLLVAYRCQSSSELVLAHLADFVARCITYVITLVYRFRHFLCILSCALVYFAASWRLSASISSSLT